MYGFDVSSVIQSTISAEIYWSTLFRLISEATCGFMYTVNLNVRYGTNSAPAPDLTDHLIIIKEGQLLHCNAELEGLYWISHPVTCKIKDSAGNVVFTKTKWLMAGVAQETDFFRNVSLPVGYYDVEWSVCEGRGSHKITVSALPQYTTNYIDIDIVVKSTEGINAHQIWDAIKEDVLAEMLVYNATVELNYAKIEGKYLIVFNLKVTAPPEEGVSSIGVLPVALFVILKLIAVIAFVVVAIPAIANVYIAQLAYNTTMQEYTYEDCAAMRYNEWIACMSSKYPAVWAEIKDKVKYPEPPPDLMDYVLYGVIIIVGLIGTYIGIKYILPAIKAR